jgi:DNA-binding MarR family transcriptional regulator
VTAEDSYDISMAVRLLLQSGREMQSAAARRMGLRTTDVQAMDLVTSAGNTISPAELADRLGIRTASASALIDRMVAAGHMHRSPASRSEPVGHRYRTNIEATQHARAAVRETLHVINDGFRQLGTDLTADEAATVLKFLRQATQILRGYADDADASEVDIS